MVALADRRGLWRAGKTSLLDCLAGRREGSGVRGEVRLNGHCMDGRAMRRASGYVQQEDVLPGTSTVWEYLWFVARLRLPDELGDAEREHRVVSLIQRLHLEKATPHPLNPLCSPGLAALADTTPPKCSHFSLLVITDHQTVIVLAGGSRGVGQRNRGGGAVAEAPRKEPPAKDAVRAPGEGYISRQPSAATEFPMRLRVTWHISQYLTRCTGHSCILRPRSSYLFHKDAIPP